MRKLSRGAGGWLTSLLGVLIGGLCVLGVATSTASAGYDDWVCYDSTNTRWCNSHYDHHSKYVEAWYTGSGNLPLAAGSNGPPGYGWIFYTNSGIFGGYNYVKACYYFECNYNSTILGRFNYRNQNPSFHTVLGRDTF